MASVDSSRLVELLEKVALLSSHDESNLSSFTVKASTLFETTIEASSSFEAVLKAGFVLLELNLLDSSSISVDVKDFSSKSSYMVSRKRMNEKFVPRITLKNMELFQFETTTTTINDRDAHQEQQTRLQPADMANGLIDNTLNHFFGFDEFRPLQKETIISTLRNENVLTVLSTGGGKSLTYMLPAVLASRPTLVVAPIKSLIADQVARCEQSGIAACQFTGDIPYEVQQAQLAGLENLKLIFSTPELLEEGAFSERISLLFENNGIERIVFDEAHTISTWGSTFRPSYKTVCEQLAKVSCPKLLLSATINHKIESELKELFGNVTVYRNSVFRENLFLEVKEKSKKLYDDLSNFIKERMGQCGIIYAVLPHDVAKIHAELVKRNVTAVKYHGQLSEEVKSSSLSQWMDGLADVIVANSSFGMGIDRPDVRFVLHTNIPPSLDDYYQQCGRAGRDGCPAVCRLYYNYSDKTSLYKLFSHQEENLSMQCGNLNDLVAFFENPVQCRHKAIMTYYGESRDNFICISNCDNCKNRGMYMVNDGTTDALKVVQAVVQLSGREITCNTLKLFLTKSNQKVIRESGMDAFSNYGALEKKFVPVILLEKFLHILIAEDILSEKVQKKGKNLYFYVTLGSTAHDLLALNVNVKKYEKVK